jgi:hypothetical protein
MLFEHRSTFSLIANYSNKQTSIAPLTTLRIVFGAFMLFSTLRFLLLGWVEEQYIRPTIHFPYFGFSWVTVPPEPILYAMFGIMLLAAFGIMVGAWFRFNALLFFLLFTYIELLDVTYYLNHYYFVSIVALLLIFTPAHRNFSVDALRFGEKWCVNKIPRYYIDVLKIMIGIVYVYAGIAKIQPEWLVHGLPLAIWLPAHDNLPLLGIVLRWELTPLLMSWAGMIFDCTVPLFLLWKKTRVLAYCAVVVFHTVTGILFQIGVFPLVMIGMTLLFFSPEWHSALQTRLISLLQLLVRKKSSNDSEKTSQYIITKFEKRVVLPFFGLFLVFQLLFPWRYCLYPGYHLWTEQGYRFGWRVMLFEKSGTAQFYVRDSKTGREGAVDNSEFLVPHQEKQMAMQPDMILHYAHFLQHYYQERGVHNPEVRAVVYVTLNGRAGQLFIDSTRNLAEIHDSWQHKEWILPLQTPLPVQ